MLIEGNIIHTSSHHGLALLCDFDNGVVRNNLIFNFNGPAVVIGAYATTWYATPDNNLFVNNTVWGGSIPNPRSNTQPTAPCFDLNNYSGNDDAFTGNVFRNNICINHGAPGIHFSHASHVPGTTIENNLVHRTDGSDQTFGVGSTLYSKDDYEALAESNASNNIDDDPSFEDVQASYASSPQSFYFDLAEGSPAIDLGIVADAPADDLRQNPRDMHPDSGCYEYGSVLPGCGDGDCVDPETCRTCPQDCDPCCGNASCETAYGENCSTCDQDCPSGAGEVCCTGELHAGDCCEDVDCSGTEVCVNHTCQPSDPCGDGTCGPDEDCTSCPSDCPTGANEVCCSGVVYAGDCCDDADCTAPDSCVGHVCTPPCEDGDSQACYEGPAGTQGVGICLGGSRTCAAGSWGTCEGQVLPVDEDCSDGLDNDCDQLVDEEDEDDCGSKVNGGCGCTGAGPGGALWPALAVVLLCCRRR
jgi:hypothetical protein